MTTEIVEADPKRKRDLVGMTVRLERAVDYKRPCCRNLARIHPGKRPHVGELRCVDCNRHRGWLPKEVKVFLEELTRTTGVAPEPIIIRDAEQKAQDMDSSAFFPSKYMKAVDLAGKNRIVTIGDVTEEMFGTDRKLALAFNGVDKRLILNKTNWTVLFNAFGAETAGWINKKITLVEITTTNLKGEMVQSIRVVIPKSAPESAPTTKQEAKAIFDDEIPW